jgi:hypothetical protein
MAQLALGKAEKSVMLLKFSLMELEKEVNVEIL